MKTHSKRSAFLSPGVSNVELVLGNQLLVFKKLVSIDILVFSYKKMGFYLVWTFTDLEAWCRLEVQQGLKPITVKMNHWPEIERFQHCVLLENCFFACSVSICTYVEGFRLSSPPSKTEGRSLSSLSPVGQVAHVEGCDGPEPSWMMRDTLCWIDLAIDSICNSNSPVAGNKIQVL